MLINSILRFPIKHLIKAKAVKEDITVTQQQFYVWSGVRRKIASQLVRWIHPILDEVIENVVKYMEMIL